MRIAVFPGGGIRGGFSARIFDRIESERPGFQASVEFYAGTSIGSMNAALFAAGVTPAQVVEFFKTRAVKVFTDRDLIDSLTHLDEVIRANYSNKELKAALTDLLGERTLGDIVPKLMIPAFDLDNQDEESKKGATRVYKRRFWKPKFMHNFPPLPGAANADCDIKVVDACLRSSAAPTYFPSYQGYVDGGMMDNNPSMSALAKAVKHTGLVTDHVLLSIGTGINPHYIPGDANDWGYKQWVLGTEVDGQKIPPAALLTMLFDGMIGVPDYQVAQFLDDRYFNLDTFLDTPIDLADVDRLPELLDLADVFDLEPVLTWLDEHWFAA